MMRLFPFSSQLDAMFAPSRDDVRQFFSTAWQKQKEGLPQEGAALVAADLIRAHPEYHALLENPDAITKEFTPENGQMNPFLHLSLHLAIAEQIAIDQPVGIAALYHKARERHDVHKTEHLFMDALGEAIWQAQRNQVPMDELAYLNAISQAISKP